MILQIHKLEKIHIPFIAKVYEENLSELHGVFIPLSEWAECLLNDPDPDELNYVAFLNGKEAAWLKINGISSEIINISMLVVAKQYQRMGIGTFAIDFAENFAKDNKKKAVLIRTTIDNEPARNCYEKHGYAVDKYIKYIVGDGVEREGVLYKKNMV